ncbi:hypothetical protein [Rugamonas sp.]|uniref:hypothetical protein n=1 Tax=Rugamonas sp. TaxID=1926287 RepID=UPI0025DA9DC1|nr:hypothetical protein [Rugamonas sp.]
MKKIALIAIVFGYLTALVPAHASQDPSVAQAVKNHSAVAQQQQQVAATAPVAQAQHVTQPLDHGPRAQSTPWLNQQARQHAAQADQTRMATHPAPVNEHPAASN